MIFHVKFKEKSSHIKMTFREVNNISDGGYDKGYKEGHLAGEAEGYGEGYTIGKNDGEVVGYEKGHDAGHAQGYTEGHTEGYNSGYDKGESDGFAKGEASGYDKGYDKGTTDGYDDGYAKGHADGEEKHILQYATAFIIGDGTNIVSFSCLFEPDCIFVTYHGADAMSAENAIMQMVFDRRSFARHGGMYRAKKSGSNTHGTMASASGRTYFAWADGVCTVEVPSSLGTPYTNGTQYICSAVKYTDKSDKELLEEEIALLADTGATIQYSKSRINNTVTDAEWQALITTKPNRTFTLI